MGLSYSAGVFFGAAVEKGSPLGDKLDEYIDRHGGTPAPTEVHGIEVSEAGSESELWLTVEIAGTRASYGRNEGDCPAPRVLTDVPEWRAAIGRFFAALGEPEPATVGWHFYGSVG